MSELKKFNLEMTIDEFEKKYWYKKELEDICRENKINSCGTKAELLEKIRKTLFEKVEIVKESKKIKYSKNVEKININSKLLECNFKFNDESRKFFAEYFKMNKFSFTKEMAAALRYAKKNNDINMTVKDLIKIYENRDRYRNKFNYEEEKTYEWNNFVKDFNKDLKNIKFLNRMKVAAILWDRLKNSERERKYTHELFLDNFSSIELYIIEIKK